MRVNGVEVTSSEDILVLPRPLAENIVIRAVAVDMDEHDKMFPEPKVPQRIVKGGVEDNPDSQAYVASMIQWNKRRMDYRIIKSLEPSKIEWETIDMNKPATWKNWTKELQEAGFAPTECNRIVNCALTANSLNEAKLTEARNAFLRGQANEAAKSSGQDTAQPNTPSGQPANDGE